MKIGYALGDFGGSIVFQSVTLYIMYFFTDVFLISAAAAGSILFIAKFWNAICDPMMGVFSDATRTRWGRKRPFLLFGALPLGLSFFLLLASPPIESDMKFIYGLVMFLFFSTMYSATGVPYGALTANMTSDSVERSKLTAFRMTFAIFAILLIAGVTKPFVATFATEAQGFRSVGLIYGLLAAFFTIVTFLSVRERVIKDEKKNEGGFAAGLKILTGNRPFLLLSFTVIFQLTAINLLASMVNYYFKYNLKSENMIPVAFLCLFLSTAAALPVWVIISKKIGNKLAFNLGMGLLSLVLLSFYVIPLSPPVIAFLFVIAGIGMSTVYLHPWAMIPDTIDYSEWKTGFRREGLLYGFFYFAFKAAAALSGLIAGIGLSSFGYRPNMEQTGTALGGIQMLMTIVPVSMIVVGIAIMSFYPLSEADHLKMNEDLAKARSRPA